MSASKVWMLPKQEWSIRINWDLFVLLHHARTNLETHSSHAYTRLFRHGRDAAGGKLISGRTGGVRVPEAGGHPHGDKEPEVRVPGRGVAHLPYFLPYG